MAAGNVAAGGSERAFDYFFPKDSVSRTAAGGVDLSRCPDREIRPVILQGFESLSPQASKESVR